jgi:hypothetical protein
MDNYILGLSDYEVKSGLVFYTFAPKGSGGFITEGEHQLSNSRNLHKTDTRGLLCFSRFNTNLQMLGLCSTNFYQELQIGYVCSPGYLSRKYWWVARNRFPKSPGGFLFATTYRRLQGTPRLPPGGKRELHLWDSAVRLAG